jgi:hypothetical protein
MGCYNPLPLKEISSQNLEGGVQETMNDALTEWQEGYRVSGQLK